MGVQLARLAKPFPRKFVHTNPSGGGSYVSHDVVTQALLAVVGPFGWRIKEIVRGDVPGKPGNPNGNSERARAGTPDLHGVVVGVVGSLTVEVDGRTVTVEEAGDCEQPHNWPHDGARMKDASSDAIKRCAMRLGLGLHLWSQDEYVLHGQLVAKGGSDDTGSEPVQPG